MYFGLMPTEVNEGNDAIINWGDNINDGFGPDNMRFIFTSYANSGAPSAAQNGLEIMRLIYNGNVGIGSVFSNTNQPASLLHLNRDQSHATFLQITNQNGTGQTANDGLRLGLEQGNNASGYLRWQENTPFIVQTDWNNSSGGTNNGERMRITSIGAPGVPHPAGASGNNVTRVAISESGNNPITKPRSLLHLGYNTGLNSFPAGSTDGWRNWMDIGAFMSNGTDNMYMGLKTESGGFPPQDRQDAVINWGDNGGSNPFNGPDNLRFIFTSTTSSIIPPYPGSPAPGVNGLEVERMVPSKASTLPAPNYGMVGIGNFSPTGPNTANANKVNAKLDIDGDLRIRTVTEDNVLEQLLVIDSNDHNRVHWINKDELVSGNPDANNGLSIDPNDDNIVQLGQLYPGTPAYNGPAELLNDREIPMNDYNIHYTGFGTQGVNRISIGKPVQPGYDAGKLSLWNQEEINGIFALTDRNNVASSNYSAIKGQIVNFEGESNYAIRGLAENIDNSGALGIGVEGKAVGSGVNIGIQAISGGNPSETISYQCFKQNKNRFF